MNRRRRIYEGKAKILYEGPEPGTLVQHFKDDATAFNNKKHDKIEGKGVLNNRISEYLFQRLGEIGVPTHFIKRLNMREQLIREVEIIPLEVVVRNVAAGSLSTRLGLDEGTALPRQIVVRDNAHGKAGFAPAFAGGAEIATAMGGAIPPVLWDGAGDAIVLDDVGVLSLGLPDVTTPQSEAKPVPVKLGGTPPPALPAIVLPEGMEAKVQ